MSDHIRIRSISLRSIRGIYFRKGARTWRIDRVSYVFTSVQGSRRLAIKIDRPSLHIEKEDESIIKPKPKNHRHTRNLTLADFNPSPLAQYAWKALSGMKNILEPYLRPLIRTYVIACIRIAIQWLPKLTQALSFDVHSVEVTFAEVPGAKLVAEEINLNAALLLTYLEQPPQPIKTKESRTRPDNYPAYGMGILKRRMAESFQRSLDKALGGTRGTGTLSLKISNILGSIPRSEHDSLSVLFLVSPGVIDLGISVKFNPREGALETQGLQISFKMGDCSAKVDLLNLLLEKVLPKKSQQATIVPSLSSPISEYGSTVLGTPVSSTAHRPTALPSPTPSFASSFFSPKSMFSPSGLMSPRPSLLSPNSAQYLSPRSPKSPSSPFFQAISASMRPRRRFLIQSPTKLKDFRDKSKLLVLHSIHISIASIGLSVLSEAKSGPYKAMVKDITANISISDPSTNLFHKKHLGSRRINGGYDPEAYSLNLSLRQITLERESRHHTVSLAKGGHLKIQVLAFQWPAPFLSPSPFLANDPNAPFLGIDINLSDAHLSDRIQDLKRLLEFVPSPQQPTQTNSPETTPVLCTTSQPFSIPRLVLDVNCGPITGRIIYDTDNGETHRAIELRNNGFVVSLDTNYNHPTPSISRTFPAASSVQALYFKAGLLLHLEPTLVRVRSQHFMGGHTSKSSTSDEDFLDDPPLLSVGIIEVKAAASAIAQIDGATNSVPVIEKASTIVELSSELETISIELWHPISVDAALQVLSLIPPRRQSQSQRLQRQTRFSKLPTGLFTRLAIGRFVLFITGPDISPDDTMDLSRGFALRTSPSLEYCSLRPNQDHWFDNLRRSKKRTLLRLPSETLTDALVAAKTFSLFGEKSGFLKAKMNNFVLRAAVATTYEPDEPAIVGREDLLDHSQDLLRIDHALVDVCLSCKSSSNRLELIDICDVSIQIPLIRIDFQLVHVYNILLGLQTIRIINPPDPPSLSNHTLQSVGDERADVVLSVHGNVTAIQAVVILPTQKLILRMDGFSGHLNSEGPPRLKWTRTTAYVLLPSQINRWEEVSESKWDEFVTLQTWEISFTQLAGSLCVSVDGDSARLRIPHGFVLAELVKDLSVSMKAIKHMAHMASAGCYSKMPSPSPEGPKSVPHLTIRLATLCLEAQDDPFESKLGLIWRTGAEAVKQRMDREQAFNAKAAAVLLAEPDLSSEVPEIGEAENEYQFDAKHSVSIKEARARLDEVHVLDWILRLDRAKKRRIKEADALLHALFGASVSLAPDSLLDFMKLPEISSDPPLFRAVLQNLCLTISPPSFSLDSLPDALYNMGSGIPRDTKYSLLVPLHIHFTLTTMHITLRDYPLPLLSISDQSSSAISWTFDTDFIAAEEMGTDRSVDWVPCPIVEPHQARHGEAPFSILVPKTIMPVKTYAAPIIKITTRDPTVFSWGVSYGPAIQDLMRIVDTLSSAPRDSSPAIGFWDKMRLVFHWTAKVTFRGDVRLYIKGSRDPYSVFDTGAGFVLCWQGLPEIRIGYENPQQELIQVTSDKMLIAIPNFNNGLSLQKGSLNTTKPFEKVCARLTSGVRFGIGFVLERSCGPDCPYENCAGSPFHRKCRYFSFRPHFDVKLEMKPSPPSYKARDDSYNGFRSDFIHLSVSLASSMKTKGHQMNPQISNIYLTPKVFAHFWSWCSLFEGASLPIRQGNYHPSRHISPKLGRHLATLKYKLSLSSLYFLHGYMDDARETWVDGVTPWVGLKGKIDELQADLHQRDEESTTTGPISNTTRVDRKKPFYAAEVIMRGIELRAMLAIFSEPMKQNTDMTAPPQRSNYRKHTTLPITPPSSIWYDLDDFVELNWSLPTDPPQLHLLPLAGCPHFTYFKRNEALSGSPQTSKFGSEHSHNCLLGKEPSVPKTQIALANARVMELKSLISENKGSKGTRTRSVMKMVALLEEYVNILKEVEIRPESAREKVAQSYHMPADIVSSEEWAEFDNVYQIHCPSISMDSAVRDIMMQYYYCSRDRRGFEYHMATRAVKFIRDQANAGSVTDTEDESIKSPTNTAQLAAVALRKILKGGNDIRTSVDIIREKNAQPPGEVKPLSGWTEDVSLRKSHCCLLLKPQIILRGEGVNDTCIVAAAQAKLQSFAIMDPLNMEDPISGKIMSRNYTSLTGLQAFAPIDGQSTKNGSVPLEVLVDLRCETDAFERLVPQTEATFHYDKFNRLRLRNNITSIISRADTNSASVNDSHLQNQTDLIRVHIPRFTVSANSEHLNAISNIVTKLLLFSDPAHKTRLDKLETLIFTYDFTDLSSASTVVSSLQGRLRSALEMQRLSGRNINRMDEEDARLGMLQLKAHIFLLSEELNLLFDTIKMAQDRYDDQADQKSALLLHASSSEISWRMLDPRRNLLSKLVVSDINFHWLSRQDSSTVNNLTIGNLTAFDGSRYALWAEILSKYDEPPNHPLLKRGLFMSASWIILAPVGGITIYETFELSFHPLRLQLDAKVGRRIMEYIWPDRGNRQISTQDPPKDHQHGVAITAKSPTTGRSSIDSPRGLHTPKLSVGSSGKPDAPALRKLGSSRSFTDLRSSVKEDNLLSPPLFSSAQGFLSPPAFLKRTHSTDSVNFTSMLDASVIPGLNDSIDNEAAEIDRKLKAAGDAQVMKTRSSQKSFVLVRISRSVTGQLVIKEGSFECHDAKIKTRELEYRNQTWSFEELVSQFIPSNMSWRGWVKMAFHQPLVPVLPVARELLSKTKWTASKTTNQPHDNPLRLLHPKIFATDDDRRLTMLQNENARKQEGPSKSVWKNALRSNKDSPSFTSLPITDEPEPMESGEREDVDHTVGRKRVKSLFGNKNSRQTSKTRTSKRRSEDILKGNP
uniref:Uncharacterized protein n=1 Tax=Psilocybe cubensis TaxID=181762 RepID=A0A8H7Y1A7_PSICU